MMKNTPKLETLILKLRPETQFLNLSIKKKPQKVADVTNTQQFGPNKVNTWT